MGRAPTWASRYDARNAAQGWSDEFLQCRLYGHDWRPYTAKYIARYRYYAIVQKCQCGSFRHQEMSTKGEVYYQRIEYARNYLTEKIGRIAGESRDMIRLVAVHRLYDDPPTEVSEPNRKTVRALNRAE